MAHLGRRYLVANQGVDLPCTEATTRVQNNFSWLFQGESSTKYNVIRIITDSSNVRFGVLF
jgi:hypothetical protein